MILNDEEFELGLIKAKYGYGIEIFSKDSNKKLLLGFNRNKYDFNSLNKNQTISLIDYIYWDTTLSTEKTYYLFDITKEKVLLTKIDDNKFELEVDIENPDMIFCPLEESFKNLKIKTPFSFTKE